MSYNQKWSPKETRCFYCNQETVKYRSTKETPHAPPNGRTTDHLEPKIRGGRDLTPNFVTSCYRCNVDKSGLTLDEYRAAIALRMGLIAVPEFKFPGEL